MKGQVIHILVLFALLQQKCVASIESESKSKKPLEAKSKKPEKPITDAPTSTPTESPTDALTCDEGCLSPCNGSSGVCGDRAEDPYWKTQFLNHFEDDPDEVFDLCRVSLRDEEDEILGPQWQVDCIPTCVGEGRWYAQCPPDPDDYEGLLTATPFQCADSANSRMGWGIRQARAVSAVVKNGSVVEGAWKVDGVECSIPNRKPLSLRKRAAAQPSCAGPNTISRQCGSPLNEAQSYCCSDLVCDGYACVLPQNY